MDAIFLVRAVPALRRLRDCDFCVAPHRSPLAHVGGFRRTGVLQTEAGEGLLVVETDVGSLRARRVSFSGQTPSARA
ncbi:hypothetical protein [Streptomyces sp. KMM 9044]|uniref:hypothetical protein n=1 Tax=Streptomyces sp. KMM 9044 TaxID=2744474 RepID=UPI002150D623|nr:hypothetical protein [Streptomyces sp. KMM 9044]WAX82227.1 hypothetical protein HUV60_033305 [Streptomyces sp. KMM 9044]